MKSARFLLGALVALVLTACSQDGASTGAADSPNGAILISVEALKDNNVKAFLETTVPPAALAEMRVEYEKGKAEAMSGADDAEFNVMMAKLTSSDAADQLFAEMQPQLQQMAPQLPFLVGMVRGMGSSSIQQQEDLTDVQKENARKALDAVGRWAEQADLASEDNLRKAIEATVGMARELDLETMDDVRALSFDQALGKADVVLAGVKDVVGVYGLDVDSILGSVEVNEISSDDNSANLEVKFDFLGEEFTTQSEMLRSEQGWYAEGADAAGS